MSFPSTYTLYTFAGVSFARKLDGDEFQPWLFGELTYTKDAVLTDGAGMGPVYIDIGANVAPPLSFRAKCVVGADRVTLKNALGTTGTLTNTLGRTDTVTLVKATPIDGPSREFYIDLTFELLPS